MDDVRVPDVPGVIVGWRTWFVMRTKGGMRLESRAGWVPGEPLRAECHRAHVFIGRAWHDAPARGCLCGIHAVSDPATLIGAPGAARRDLLRCGAAVAGQVALWGRVIEHERGWRAEHGKPLSIVPLVDWTDDGETDAIREVRERYDLPLADCPEMRDALAVYVNPSVVMAPRSLTVQFGVAAADFQAALLQLTQSCTNVMQDVDDLQQRLEGLYTDPTSDKPTTPRKPSYTALNPNEPRNRMRGGGRRGPR